MDQFFGGLDEILQTNTQLLTQVEPDVLELANKTFDVWQQERLMKHEQKRFNDSIDRVEASLGDRVKPIVPAVLQNVFPNFTRPN
jgi:hypothetical protein